MSGASSSASFEVWVQVMGIRDGRIGRFAVQVAPALRVRDFKKLIEEQSRVSSTSQRIVYKGKLLPDAMTLGEAGVQKSSTIHLAPLVTKGGTLQANLKACSDFVSQKWVAGGALALIFGASLFKPWDVQ